jgi:hypothetical protein
MAFFRSRELTDFLRPGTEELSEAEGQAEIRYTVRLPNELLGPFLQQLRDFEARHHEQVISRVEACAPSLSVDEVRKIFDDIRPPFSMTISAKLND